MYLGNSYAGFLERLATLKMPTGSVPLKVRVRIIEGAMYQTVGINHRVHRSNTCRLHCGSKQQIFYNKNTYADVIIGEITAELGWL